MGQGAVQDATGYKRTSGNDPGEALLQIVRTASALPHRRNRLFRVEADWEGKDTIPIPPEWRDFQSRRSLHDCEGRGRFGTAALCANHNARERPHGPRA